MNQETFSDAVWIIGIDKRKKFKDVYPIDNK